MAEQVGAVKLSDFNLSEQKVVVGSAAGEKRHHKGMAGGLIWALILFIFLVLIIFIIIVAWNPRWLRRGRGRRGKGSRDGGGSKEEGRDCGCDYSKAFLWAIVIAIVLVIIFWILAGITAGFARCGWKKHH
jgi:uncharacterized membrane protein (DUF485 family)